MDVLKHWNGAMAYIEAHLTGECKMERAARLACVTPDSFQRFFSYMTGMTLAEYIRRRRLTLAAQDLQNTRERVVDLAVKYGYNSTAAFSRAFFRQHGLSPSLYRARGGAIRVYPPASFQIAIKGAKEMNLEITEKNALRVWGISRAFDHQKYQSRESLRHIMWSAECDHIPGKLCEGEWNQPGNTAYDGIWYGIWQNGRYMIARKMEKRQGLEEAVIPSGTYAIFRTECGGRAWEEFPRLFEMIFDSWLPSSSYRQTGDCIVEVLHLWTDHDLRQKNRYYEVWVPIEKKRLHP